MTPRSTVLAIRDLCGQGLPQDALVPALLEVLHELVPSHRNLFDWTDEQGRLLRYFFEGPIDLDIARRYFDVFHNRRECECMPGFGSIVEQPAGVRGAAMQEQPGFYESALYREIWKPQGLHTRIEGIVRDAAGRLLGSLVLYRGPADQPFTGQDEQRLAQVLPYVANGLRLAGCATPEDHYQPSPEPPQMALVSAGGVVVFSTAGFVGALLAAQDGVTPASLGQPLSQLLQSITRMLSPAPFETWRDGPRRLTLSNALGRWSLSATPLDNCRDLASSPGLLLTLRRLEPRCVALARALRALPLTSGQTRVARALYAGLGQREIANQLGVGSATVVDHVRKLYTRLDIGSAAALRTLLDRKMAGLAA